jgi:hypothetical protein
MNVAGAARAGALGDVTSRLVVMEFIWRAKTLDIFKHAGTDDYI